MSDGPSEDEVWIHSFINCVPFGEHCPNEDIVRAHKIVDSLVCKASPIAAHILDAKKLLAAICGTLNERCGCHSNIDPNFHSERCWKGKLLAAIREFEETKG